LSESAEPTAYSLPAEAQPANAASEPRATNTQ